MIDFFGFELSFNGKTNYSRLKKRVKGLAKPGSEEL
jgi:hypothetical protein